MKKMLLTLALIAGIVSAADAQWVSPNDGSTYHLIDLVMISEGAIVLDDSGAFLVMQDIILSDSDILEIAEIDDTNIALKGTSMTIHGTLIVDSPTWINGSSGSSMCFDRSANSIINMTSFSSLGGISLIGSDVVFTGSSFSNFTTEYTSAAVTYTNCDPTFTFCNFIRNEGAAISSAANAQGSPTISNCKFQGNNTANTNNPQINLGPGSTKDIVVEGNEITGEGHNMVGGFSISDVLGVGVTRLIFKNNSVVANRYGYNQQGDNIYAEITGNDFLSNDLETNPMNGGSGVSIYGSTTNCAAVLRDNTIIGNLWGITAIYMHNIDMGTEDDWGHNRIYKNMNETGQYALYNNSSCDITAVGNYWGTTDLVEVEEIIYHKTDDPSLGLVTYNPIWLEDGVEEISDDVQINDNRVYSIDGRYLGNEVPEDYRGVYIQNGKKYVILNR